jgi:alkanesulfonate monooxygenase SsuD/methylene tetrahydromethanopterin reductase-like flavin-dependent oxidoreductase (luciferase family)
MSCSSYVSEPLARLRMAFLPEEGRVCLSEWEGRVMARVRLGALCWSQYTTWDELFAAGQRADRLGFDTLWTWDHLYPVVGADVGPIFEGWLTLAAWAQATEHIRLGMMVAANTFRNPALTAKMATTLDHISHGRAILGIGAGWFGTEHAGFGISFGDGPEERLQWLGEALPVIRGMFDETRPVAAGPHYVARSVRNYPEPVQQHLPILIGGGGEDVTLKLVARYGDANNISGGVNEIRRKEAALLRHCDAIGRDPSEIERTTGVGPVFIRDTHAEALKAQRESFQRNGRATAPEYVLSGTPNVIAERLSPYLELGYRHIIAGFPSPHDEESMDRFATEVRELLDSSSVPSIPAGRS